MGTENDEQSAPEATKQGEEVEDVQPADMVKALKDLGQSAPQTGQVQISAVFSQAVNPSAWTPENLRAAIDGMVRQSDQNHATWLEWYKFGRRRFYFEFGVLAAMIFSGIWFTFKGHRWGIDLMIGAAGFYAGIMAGRGQKSES